MPAEDLGVLGGADSGEFMSFAVDGRQQDRSVGLTFEELQNLALEWRLRHAALGPAGNDVYFVTRSNGEFCYGGSPSGGRSRAMPGVMLISSRDSGG